MVFDLLARDNASPAFRRVGEEAETAGRKTSAFGSVTSKAMGAAAGAIAGVGIGALLGGAVKAASDLNETVNKTNVIFGNNAREVQKWAQTSARSFGLSEQAALEAASGLGNMLTQLGYTADEALKASTSTVQLAADLGSFNNLDTGDVLDRIGAAMRGEYDSLQLLIPNINAARVESEALATTGKSVASELTAQEKAAATLAIVQRDGAAAAGDFAETADGLANSQKILNAEWQNAQARLGELLVGPMTGIVNLLTNAVLPAFEGLVDIVGGAVDLFTDLPGPIQVAVAAFGTLSLLRGPLTSVFETISLKALYAKDAIAATAFNVEGLKTSFAGLAGAAATLATITVLAKAVDDVVDFANAGDDAREVVDALSESLEGLEGTAQIDANAVAVEQLRDKLADAQAIIDEFENMGAVEWALWGQFSLGSDEVANAEEAVALYRAEIRRLEEQSALAAGSGLFGLNDALALGGEMAAGAAAATAEAAADWLLSLQSINEGFVEPLSAYKGLLDEKTTAEREQAEATAASTEDATDSWEDHVREVDVSLDEYATRLEEQILAQENWRANLVTVSQRGGSEVAAILAEMGVEGAQITADMATATEEDFQRMATALIREAELGGEGATAALQRELAVMAAVGRTGARSTAAEIARELGIGVDEVERIAAQYGVELADGVNPILRSLGKPTINGQRMPGLSAGGYTGDGGKYEPKGIVHGGEYVEPMESVAYYGKGIFEALHQRRIPRDALPGYAGGGFVSTAGVPKPPSVAPYTWAIGDPADATMDHGYDEVVKWLAANLEPPAASGGSSSGLLPIMAAARQYVMDTYGVRNIGGYSYRNIAGTNVLSDHALGKAIDIMTTNLPLGWAIANDFAYGPAHSRFNAENVIWQQSISSSGGPFVGMADRGSPTQNHRDHVHVDTYRTGTPFVPHDGLAYLHKGERVVPAEYNRQVGSGRGGAISVAAPNVAVHVTLDGEELRHTARVEADRVVVNAFSDATDRAGYNG